MAYTFEQLLAADPSNPSNIAQNGSITIFAPGDPTMTPLTITDPDGSPLPNPFTVNANGFGPAFAHATLDRVAWSGGGFTGFVTSYEGMKEEAVAARAAAESAAATAGAEATAVAEAAIAGATDEATAAKTAAETAASNASASATAAANAAALVNAPADTAIAAAVNGNGATKTALNATYATPSTVTTAINTAAADPTGAIALNFAPRSVMPRITSARRRWPAFNIVAGNSTGETGWSGFAVAGGAYSLNDTTDIALGTHSKSLTTEGTGSYSNVIKKVGLTLDMTGKGLVVWLKATNPTALNLIAVDLGDDAMTNRYRALISGISAKKNILASGEWTPVFIPWTQFSVFGGAPVKTNLTAALFIPVDINSGGVKATIKIGGIGTYTENTAYPNGVCTFSFDDTEGSAYTYAVPKLAGKGYTATVFPIVERIGGTGYLTLAQLKAMQNVYGWEIGAHCMTVAQHIGLDTLSNDAVKSMLNSLRQWQADNGFISDAFAYPIGTHNAQVMTTISQQYAYARTNDGLPGTPYLPHPMAAPAVSLTGTLTLAAAQAMVTAAAANKTAIHFLAHKLIPSGTPGVNEWLSTDFNALVDSVAAANMTVVSAGDLTKL